MPFRNILAIPLALALGQYAWAQTPTGHPQVQHPDYPDMGGPSTGGGGKFSCIGPYENNRKHYVYVKGVGEQEFVSETKALEWMADNCQP